MFTDFDRIRFGPDGDLLLFEEEELPSTLRDAFVFTGAKRAFGGGTPTLNARFGNSKFYQETERDGFRGRLPDASPDRRTDIRFDPEFWEGEVGADWERTVATDWSLKLLGLGSLRDQELGSRELIREPVDGPPAITRFD